jgi:NADPH:quinone reductase-like Zn-dependent oxidoreductase
MMNRAAYLPGIKQPLQVGPANLPVPAKNEILIRNYAVAINPLDVGQQQMGFRVQKWPHVRPVIHHSKH